MSHVTSAASQVWEQAHRVRSSLDGPAWHLSFSDPAPVPPWLVDLVDGHMERYTGPDPVLFRTSGVGMKWFVTAEDHSNQLEVTDPHRLVDVDALRSAAELLEDAGAIVDVDAYVWGDGEEDGKYSARLHCLFGVFTHETSLTDLEQQLAELGNDFELQIVPSPVCLTAQITPCLPFGGRH